jgi:translation initiation factor 1
VTIVTGIPLDGDALKELAQTHKGKCGAGGTVKDGVIEIQGEHRELLQKTLETLGYRVKQSGG